MATADSVMKFAQGKTFGVVVDQGRNAETLLQEFLERHLAPGGNVCDRIDHAVLDQARRADSDAADVWLNDGLDGFKDFFEDDFLVGARRNRPLMQGNDPAVLDQARADIGAAKINAYVQGVPRIGFGHRAEEFK